MDQTTLDAPEASSASEETTNDQTASTANANSVSPDSLDMVRNILFGEQVRENKADLNSLERFVKTSLNSLQEEMQQHVDTLHERLETQDKNTQQRIDKETKDIRQTLQKQRDELLERIQETQEQLQHNKVDRHALSSLLTNVAKELADPV